MKKQITKIQITRDTDDEIMLEVVRKNRNGVDFITSNNSIDFILDTISDILYEPEREDDISAGTDGCNYRLVNKKVRSNPIKGRKEE